MRRMFKYLKKEYADSLLTMGLIRVGTLHDFRRADHKKGITDQQEGKKKVKHAIPHLFVSDLDDPSVKKIEDNFPIKFGQNSLLENCAVAREINHINCFIWCTSKISSAATMQEFEEANACIEIFNPQAFYDELTKTLNSKVSVTFRGVYPVIYQSREEEWNGIDWGLSPALIKEPSFSQQYEIRAIWEASHGLPISPLILCNSRLTAFCRSVKL